MKLQCISMLSFDKNSLSKFVKIMFNFSKRTCSNHPITTLKENSTSHHSSINMLWHLTFFIVNSMGIICLINHEKIHVSHEKKFAAFVCSRIFQIITHVKTSIIILFFWNILSKESHMFFTTFVEYYTQKQQSGDKKLFVILEISTWYHHLKGPFLLFSAQSRSCVYINFEINESTVHY